MVSGRALRLHKDQTERLWSPQVLAQTLREAVDVKQAGANMRTIFDGEFATSKFWGAGANELFQIFLHLFEKCLAAVGHPMPRHFNLG